MVVSKPRAHCVARTMAVILPRGSGEGGPPAADEVSEGWWKGRGPRRLFCDDNEASSQTPPPPRCAWCPSPANAGADASSAPCAARGRNIAMSKSEDDLSPEEWQARHDAACAIVARKYATCSGSGAIAGISRAAAPGGAAATRAPVCRAATGAFPMTSASPRELGWQPKRRQTPTALRAPRTAMSTVRSACTKQRVRRCEPRCERRCGNDQSRRRVLPFAAGYATRRPT